MSNIKIKITPLSHTLNIMNNLANKADIPSYTNL
jgi:hypothetical protein